MVIVGGGFGGLAAAKAFRNQPVDVTVLDRRNHHLFTPLLYQVASAALSPGDIASPIRWILRRQANVEVLLAGVDRILLSSEPYRFTPTHRDALARDSRMAGKRIELIDGEKVSWYGVRAIEGVDYLMRRASAA